MARFTWQRPPLYPKQEAAIFHAARIVVIEASTKTGKTAGCAAWLVEAACAGKPGQHFWWVAPTRTTSRIAYRRIMRVFQPHATQVQSNKTSLTIELPNGATLWFKSADNPDGLYGEDVHAAVIDEATRCKDETWSAVRSTLTATQGRVRIIGNVKGRRNWAYRLARKAEAGEQDMHYAKLIIHDAVEAGIVPASEVDAARRDLPEAVFNELYLAIPSEDGQNPFGASHLRACAVKGLGAGPVSHWGWDLAKSVDWTVGIGLNRRGQVAVFERFQRDWNATKITIATLVKHTPAVIDQTGVGNPIVEDLQRNGRSNVEGFTFTSNSKQLLMETLALALQERRVQYPADGPLQAELESFEFEHTRTGVRYAAPDGMHDDCVCALALAVYRHRSQSTVSLTAPIATPLASPYGA